MADMVDRPYMDLEGNEGSVAADHGPAQHRRGGVDEADHGYPLVPVQRVADESQPLAARGLWSSKTSIQI